MAAPFSPQEKAADEKLSSLAEDGINEEAAGAAHADEDEGDAEVALSARRTSSDRVPPSRHAVEGRTGPQVSSCQEDA